MFDYPNKTLILNFRRYQINDNEKPHSLGIEPRYPILRAGRFLNHKTTNWHGKKISY